MKKIVQAVIAIAAAVLVGCQAAPTDVKTQSWSEIEQSARGQTATFAMWGGDERINAWIDGFVAPLLKDRYEVTVNRVAMDASVFVNKLSDEKKAGKDIGSLDLLWINGENFRRAKTEGLLYGPILDQLPSFAGVNPADVATDFGTPIEGYEVPYGRAQFVFEYDSAKISDPPRSFVQLREWVKKHPGRFTYPVPMDFTGSAFVRQVFYDTTGGYQTHLAPFDQGTFDAQATSTWEYLKEIQPFLWQGGKTYPTDKAKLDTLFERGEVDFNLNYNQGGAQGLILAGRYPATVRTFVMEGQSLGNVHFTAVPFNSPHKAAALVLANFLLSAEAQASKNDPAHWGDFTVLDPSRLSPEDQARFAGLNLGDAVLPLATLSQNVVPEIAAPYGTALEKGWEQNVPTQP